MKYLYGYRYGEVILPKMEPVKGSAKITLNPYYHAVDLSFRRPMKINLGCALVGFCNPQPDTGHAHTALRGACKRFIRQTPIPDPDMFRELGEFVEEWLRSGELVPLAPDTNLDTRDWLRSAPYPKWRKDVLLMKWERVTHIFSKTYTLIKSFIKDEPYPEFKHARPINSRADEFKAEIGPWFKAIEKELFKLPHFIKKIPRHEWPEYILNRLQRTGVKYIATDYTAFESHFTREVMTNIEFRLYKYMTQYLPNHQHFWKMLDTVIAGKNTCQFKWFKIECQATRMSGEMNTSLGNGFANFMLMSFMAKKVGCTDFVGVFEGDDGLCSMTGTPPTAEDFAKCGFTIKLEVHQLIETASFCGVVFSPEDRRTLCDPIDVLMDFGWTGSRYAEAKPQRLLELLKAKSLSLLYQYPGCPVVSSLAQYGLRITKGVRVGRVLNSLNQWEREQLIDALRYRAVAVPVGLSSRFVVQEKYGLRVEHQLEIEAYLDSLTEMQSLVIPLVAIYAHKDSFSYYHDYQSTGGEVMRPILALKSSVKEEQLPLLDGTDARAASLVGS